MDSDGSRDEYPPLPGRPRVWPSLLAGCLGTVVASVLGMGALIVLLVIQDARIGTLGASDVASRAVELASTGPGLVTFLIVMEISVAGIAWRLASLSPVPVRKRLSLTPPRLRWWAWPVLVIATLGVRTAGLYLIGTLTGPPSEERMRMLRGLVELEGMLAVIALIGGSFLAGFCEELLFRGYVQARLVQRWGAPLAIGVTAVLFAIAHGDPLYAALILPLGVWLGFVAWRTDSVWPAVACHAGNNLVLLVAARVSDSSDEWFTWNFETVGWLIASFVAIATGLVVLRQMPERDGNPSQIPKSVLDISPNLPPE